MLPDGNGEVEEAQSKNLKHRSYPHHWAGILKSFSFLFILNSLSPSSSICVYFSIMDDACLSNYRGKLDSNVQNLIF